MGGLTESQIERIISDIDEWVEWYKSGRQGNPYPSIAPYARLTPRSNNFKSYEPKIEQHILNIDRAYSALTAQQKRVISQEHMVTNATVVHRARRLRLTVKVYRITLYGAYVSIHKTLQSIRKQQQGVRMKGTFLNA